MHNINPYYLQFKVGTYGAAMRKIKRAERKANVLNPVQEAYYEGEGDAYSRQPSKNRYPAGKRHDAYAYGYNEADPLGIFHGRNV